MCGLRENSTCDKDAAAGLAPLVRSVELSEGQLFEHRSDRNELLLLLSGSIVLSGGCRQDRTVVEKQFSLLPPDEAITLSGTEPARLIICRLVERLEHCKHADLSEFRKPGMPGDSHFPVLPFRQPVERFVESLSMALESGLSCEPYLICKLSELMFLLRACYTESERDELSRSFSRRHSEFRSRILSLENLVKTAKEMAGRCHMTEVGFRKRFKQEMGVPPKEYLLERKKWRIDRDLRNGTKSNYELCEEYGFTSASSLANFCREHLGGTPSDLRRKWNDSEKITGKV
jgi:AraC-like DNA-binding protein